MSTLDIQRVILAILLLVLGFLMFRYSIKVKAKGSVLYANYICYGGFLLFIGAGLSAYVSDIRISIGSSILLMIGASICVLIGKKKAS